MTQAASQGMDDTLGTRPSGGPSWCLTMVMKWSTVVMRDM